MARVHVGIPDTLTSGQPTVKGDVTVAMDIDPDDAGKGMEGMTLDEYRIPFVRILDPKSPQCAPAPHGLGCKPGTFLNIATGEIFDGERGFDFVPCYRDHNFVEWKKRDPNGGGGGFVAIHPVSDPLINQLRETQGRFKKLQHSVDNVPTELAESFYLYGIMIDQHGTQSRIILGFSGMQIKKYQAFVNRYDTIQYDQNGKLVKPPLWQHKWHVRSTYEKRSDQSWFGYVITLANGDKPIDSFLPSRDPLYVTGRSFYELMKSGKAKADYASREPGDDSDADIPM